MTTKSKRNLPLDDEPEYTFGKFKPTTEAPEGSPEEGKVWGQSIDDATPEEWNRAALATSVGKLMHPADTPKEESCPVERPDHYNTGSIEAIEAIRASMDSEQYFGYLKGNVMKYLWRYDYKEKPVEDLRKADWYLNRLIDALIEDRQ